MLQPTPSLLLRPATSVSASLRLLTHPKLPLTPTESRQLLNVLTTSFRNQLAQEHGATSTNPSPLEQSASQRPIAKKRTGTHTERHLSDILTNPLFSLASTIGSSTSRDPMEVFEQACSRGLMTSSRARACLLAKKAACRSSNEGSSAIRNGSSGAKVFKWLLSSGAMENSAWLSPSLESTSLDRRITPDIIFEFLILERRDQLLWDLFEHHVSNRTKDGKPDLLLYHISRTLARCRSLDAAYDSVSKAEAALTSTGFSQHVRQRVLAKAMNSLVQATLVTETPGASVSLFENFVEKLKASKIHPLYLRQLLLHHPSQPDASPAMNYLKSLQEPLENTPSETKAHIWLALDTAKLLLRQDRYAEARWVMNLLEQRYPEHIGARPGHVASGRRTPQLESEEENLRLLDILEAGLC